MCLYVHGSIDGLIWLMKLVICTELGGGRIVLWGPFLFCSVFNFWSLTFCFDSFQLGNWKIVGKKHIKLSPLIRCDMLSCRKIMFTASMIIKYVRNCFIFVNRNMFLCHSCINILWNIHTCKIVNPSFLLMIFSWVKNLFILYKKLNMFLM